MPGQRDLSSPGVKDQISNALHGRKEQLMRAACLTAMRSDAKVVNYLARRIVESNGQVPSLGMAAPAAAPATPAASNTPFTPARVFGSLRRVRRVLDESPQQSRRSTRSRQTAPPFQNRPGLTVFPVSATRNG